VTDPHILSEWRFTPGPAFIEDTLPIVPPAARVVIYHESYFIETGGHGGSPVRNPNLREAEGPLFGGDPITCDIATVSFYGDSPGWMQNLTARSM
jgi:hypothetical protein